MSELYHICNRGIAKGEIFNDSKDYYRFVFNLYKLNNIKGALRTRKTSFSVILPERDKLVRILKWCLLPNHYHLLLEEITEGGAVEFIKRLGNAYTKYFNIKNTRSGYLFQNKAKIVHIEDDPQFLYIPTYIDLNPLDIKFPLWKKRLIDPESALDFLYSYRWSSFSKNKEFDVVHNDEFFYTSFEISPEQYKKELRSWLSKGVSTWQVDTPSTEK